MSASRGGSPASSATAAWRAAPSDRISVSAASAGAASAAHLRDQGRQPGGGADGADAAQRAHRRQTQRRGRLVAQERRQRRLEAGEAQPAGGGDRGVDRLRVLVAEPRVHVGDEP